MKIGSYSINVSTSKMPQKVATGFGKVFEGFAGATYNPIAYLGSKLVNGTNHAILAEQILVVKEDVKSIVLLILNEKPGDVDGSSFSIVEIRTLISNGGRLGGLNISPITDIPEDAKKVFEKHFGGFFGANITPFALLATQVDNGLSYTFAVESKMIVAPTKDDYNRTTINGDSTIQIIKVFSNYDNIETLDVISGKPVNQLLGANNDSSNNSNNLEYAFTWLKGSNTPDVSWP